MLRTYLPAGLLAGLLAAALPAVTISAGLAEQARSSSWHSERMRLTPAPKPAPRPGSRPGPKLPTFSDELHGNCAGLTVMIKTRIEWLKALEAKASGQQWPPPSAIAQWARRPAGGDFARHRERIARLNAVLGAKGCQTVDVQAELQRTPAAGARTKGK
jgi:hypothetical protein